MQSIKHIKSLLYKYDTVIVPGFGAFQGTYASASRDKRQNLIYPPHKKLTYNEKLTFDDAKLQNEMAESLNISTDEAAKIIKEDVSKLFEKLNLNQSVDLEGIGTIRKNERGIYELEQDTSINYLRESYGLKAVELPKKSGIQPAKTVPVEKKIVETEIKEQAPIKEVSEAKVETPKEEVKAVAKEPEKGVITEGESSGWAWLLLPLVLIGLGFLFWKFILSDRNKTPELSDTKTPVIEQPIIENKDSIEKANIAAARLAAIQDSIKSAQEAAASQNNTTESTKSNDTYVPPPRTASPTSEVNAERGYYMVISSTPKKTLADKKTQDLLSRNQKAATLAGPKGYWRTAIWLNADESAAKARMSELKGAFPDGWLLKF